MPFKIIITTTNTTVMIIPNFYSFSWGRHLSVVFRTINSPSLIRWHCGGLIKTSLARRFVLAQREKEARQTRKNAHFSRNCASKICRSVRLFLACFGGAHSGIECRVQSRTGTSDSLHVNQSNKTKMINLLALLSYHLIMEKT